MANITVQRGLQPVPTGADGYLVHCWPKSTDGCAYPMFLGSPFSILNGKAINAAGDDAVGTTGAVVGMLDSNGIACNNLDTTAAGWIIGTYAAHQQYRCLISGTQFTGNDDTKKYFNFTAETGTADTAAGYDGAAYSTRMLDGATEDTGSSQIHVEDLVRLPFNSGGVTLCEVLCKIAVHTDSGLGA